MCTCSICGEKYNPDDYISSTKKSMIENNVCFTCFFWEEQYNIDNTNKDTGVIIDGSHYRICPDNDDAYFRGFGGRKFTIRFNDGRVIVTHNLWHQGKIPDGYFRGLMPDNAIFL